MSYPFKEEQLIQLKLLVELCKTQPKILHHPKLAFFKDYLASLGVTIPTATFGAKSFTPSGDSTATSKNAENNEQEASDLESSSESDVELDMDGVIDADSLDNSQVMGDSLKEVTDEERDQSDEKRSEAIRAYSEQKYDEAIKLYTEAIQLNPQSALLFAKRGQIYLKLNKPNACIKDCTHALELNCDSAAAYKFRGRAYRLLGKFEEASHDLCESLKIDYDDQTNEWLNEMKPNAEKLRQHKLGVQRKKEEKEQREKVRRVQKAQEARANAARAQAESSGQAAPGKMPQKGQHPAAQLLNPETMDLFADPEVCSAMLDITLNPANFVKYQNNPKITGFIDKIYGQEGQGGATLFPGGFPGADGSTGAPAKPPTDDDVGLD